MYFVHLKQNNLNKGYESKNDLGKDLQKANILLLHI
jgi:hypothetical protein